MRPFRSIRRGSSGPLHFDGPSGRSPGCVRGCSRPAAAVPPAGGRFAALLSAALLLLSGCALHGTSSQEQEAEALRALSTSDDRRTPLEIREIQTRVFDECRPPLAMKALVDVLQDDGFVVKNAVTELGLLSAVKEVDVGTTSAEVFNTIIFGDEARWDKNMIVEATANVSAVRDGCRVRVTFQLKTYNNRGEVVAVRPITAPAFHQQFFAKVDKGLFIHRHGL